MYFNEARRFFRFVLPGLIFVIETWLLLAISQWDKIRTPTITYFTDHNIGWVASLIVLSGAIGFLLNFFHNILHWSIWMWLGVANDQRPAINILLRHRIISLVDPATNKKINNIEPINRRKAWQMIVVLWYQRSETSPLLKGITERAHSLSDQMHNSGISLTGIILAIIILFISNIQISDSIPSYESLFVAIILFAAHFMGYYRTSKIVQGVVDTALVDALMSEKKANGIIKSYYLER